jgi:putative membrane protein
MPPGHAHLHANHGTQIATCPCLPTLPDLALPWQFSPTVLLTTTLAVALYARGVSGIAIAVTHPRWIAYFTGVALIYLALQTACAYYASHMFFVLQLQLFVLHDLGPALLAAAAPGAALWRGTPQWARTCLQAALRTLGTPPRPLLDARIATALYIVSQLVWLLPRIAFEVMLSNRLFEIMNWSAVLGALPFWHLILDPRPHPLARLRLRQRFLALFVAMLPMTLASAALAFSQTSWYPVYAVCGRFLPISPIMDQELGGTAMWVPDAMLFGLVFFLFLGRKLDQGAIPLTSGLEGTSPGRADPTRGTAAGRALGCPASAPGRE